MLGDIKKVAARETYFFLKKKKKQKKSKDFECLIRNLDSSKNWALAEVCKFRI